MARPVNLIVACSENRVIGRDGKLPWRIAEDWNQFRQMTTGAAVVLGRVSFLAWKSIFEDDREAVVITSDASLAGPRVRIAGSLDEALRLAETTSRPIFICGGEQIFAEAVRLPQATRLYLTLVHATIDGDRTFPDWRSDFPRVLEQRESSDQNFRYTFYTLARKGSE